MNFLILCLSILYILETSNKAKAVLRTLFSDRQFHEFNDEYNLYNLKPAIEMSRGSKDFLYILRCEYLSPVMWLCKNNNMSQQKSHVPKNEKMKYGITLTIIGYTAFYRSACLCVKETEKEPYSTLISTYFAYTFDVNHTVPKGDAVHLWCGIYLPNGVPNIDIFESEWILPDGVQWDQSRMSALQYRNNNNLTILNAEINDSGDYTCKLSYGLTINGHKVRNWKINSTYNVAIIDLNKYIDSVQMRNSDHFYLKANTSVYMGMSAADILYKPKWTDPNGTEIIDSEKYRISVSRTQGSTIVYHYHLEICNLHLLDTGTYTLKVVNRLDIKNTLNLIVADAPIVYLNDVLGLTDEEACIQCMVKSYPKADVTLTFEPCSGVNQCSSQPTEMNTTSTEGASVIEFIYNLTLMQKSSGIIRCKAVNNYGTVIGKSQIIIRDTDDNMKIYGIKDKDVILVGNSVTITCAAFAYYFSDDINWYNPIGKLINETKNIVIKSKLNSYYFEKSLTFKSIRREDRGQYECRAKLRNSKKTEHITRSIFPEDTSSFGTSWIAGISMLIAILIGSVIYLYIRVKLERKVSKELKAAGLANFEEGALNQINPALTFDEQADLLPYDRRFEFPRDKIELGMQLGAGAFGVVFKAYAKGIQPNEKETIVAVKMVKRDAHNDVIKALVSELKIMVHLGRHLNVVNLLGAVTKNIAKRELMVIVEYCHYGNVRDFLICNRDRFVNQIDTNTGTIDASVITKICLDHFEGNRINENTDSGCSLLSNISMTQTNLNQTRAKNTIEMTNVTKDMAESDFQKNYINQSAYVNIKSDSTEEIIVTTGDLISWAFQLANGMDYLSSTNVLHGDLAARNILLCKGYIVKICDFGLARSMYKSDYYKKQGDALLPVKWMALESLTHHIFSKYTDVWSFGILLWELFSLGTVPYPDIHSYDKLIDMLTNGYRMKKPPYANDDIHSIMLECWYLKPEERPLFNVLKEKFAAILGEEITDHYMVMNEPYVRANKEHSNLMDYLSKMENTDEMAPLPPRYVNTHIMPDITSPNYYLPMSSIH